MSGGYFNYVQNNINLAADEVLEEIEKDQFEQSIIDKFKQTEEALRKAAKMITMVDFLMEGDYGEESFLKRWEEEGLNK